MEAFYRDVLGLPLLRRWPFPGGGDRSSWLDLGGGAFLALELPKADVGISAVLATSEVPGTENSSESTGLHLLALRIERGERERWERRLEAAGHPIHDRTAYTLYVRDPEGNRVGLSHYPVE